MIKVFLPCSGVGQVHRGFETFTQECFDALKNETDIQLTLFKGAGALNDKREKILWNLQRTDWKARFLGKILGRNSYNIEQVSFFISLLPYLNQEDPDIIFFSDANLGNPLWHWRNYTKKKYKLLFCNGAPEVPPFPRWDHIQQLTFINYQKAIDAGVSQAKQSLIPLGFYLPNKVSLLTSLEREKLRLKLNLPSDRTIIISVGWISKNHKRMDYLIREVAALPQPRPYLLLLGYQDENSPKIIALGNELLGIENFQVRTVEPSNIATYYQVADMFALASLKEGFGRVYVEAMSYGLPCVAHDSDITRYVLGDRGYLADLSQPGNLTQALQPLLSMTQNPGLAERRHEYVYKNFSWDHLRPQYLDMINYCNAS